MNRMLSAALACAVLAGWGAAPAHAQMGGAAGVLGALDYRVTVKE